MNSLVLTLTCPDAVGHLARITGFIAESGGNLLEVGQYTDPVARWFFTRLSFTGGLAERDPRAFAEGFGPLAQALHGEWQLRPAAKPVRTVILVSREDHCLVDLLWRWRSRELNIDLAGVVSNHEDARSMVEREGVSFDCIDFTNKDRAFARLGERLREMGAELVVLARFMQVIPDALCREYEGRIINIHHSFLPAFVGAQPYRRAFERGVKLIGATCHYATDQLDEGPIIEQEVSRVEHYHDPEDLVRLGRDCERLALARGVRFHVEGRVLVHGNRAIVFRD